MVQGQEARTEGGDDVSASIIIQFPVERWSRRTEAAGRLLQVQYEQVEPVCVVGAAAPEVAKGPNKTAS